LYAGGWDNSDYLDCDDAKYNSSLKYEETKIVYEDATLAGEMMWTTLLVVTYEGRDIWFEIDVRN